MLDFTSDISAAMAVVAGQQTHDELLDFWVFV